MSMNCPGTRTLVADVLVSVKFLRCKVGINMRVADLNRISPSSSSKERVAAESSRVVERAVEVVTVDSAKEAELAWDRKMKAKRAAMKAADED